MCERVSEGDGETNFVSVGSETTTYTSHAYIMIRYYIIECTKGIRATSTSPYTSVGLDERARLHSVKKICKVH